MTVQDIKKAIGNRLSKSKIYEILSHYFYSAEFIEWLENKENENIQPIGGISAKKWCNILKFDEVERNAKG